ncbi:hypothetical protein GCM10009798_43290 [Nocardioides panacihumi]|uniref:Blue (type 1) copper domain-containing protein n=2 Tax=Nocardioides panacihumi TaxID=400774 RepID=A0ABN2RYX8_9ACTN
MVVVTVLVGALAAGCASGSTGMMGHNGSGSNTPGPGTGRSSGGSEPGPAPFGHGRSRLTCSAPSSLPGTTVYVMLGDMGMPGMRGGVAPVGPRMMLRAAPARVPAGEVSFVVANMGRHAHEMVVLPLAQGRSIGQRVAGADGRIDEAGSLGEASASCAGGEGRGIGARAVGWTTVTLAPGSYELVCNLPHHYSQGMRQLLVAS